jgi:pimeloyl-ACP methyl ester carboxylesterase
VVLSALPGGLFGARHGDPPAGVVALHGWRRTHTDFDAVLAGYPAAAPDLPGFGATPAPPAAWGSADYAAAVLPLCQEGPPVVLVGHSFGGKVAVALAAAHPDRVAALVLTGAPLLRPAGQPRPRPSLAHRVARGLHRAGLLSDARMEARRQAGGSDDYRAAVGVMRDVLVRSIAEMDDGTYRRELGGLTCPVELVWGERDTAAPPAVAHEAATLVGGATVTVVPGVGHHLPTEAPDALRAAIDRHR